MAKAIRIVLLCAVLFMIAGCGLLKKDCDCPRFAMEHKDIGC